MQAVIGREANMGFIDTVTAIPHIKSGDLRALAVTSAGRVPAYRGLAYVVFERMPLVSVTQPGF